MERRRITIPAFPHHIIQRGTIRLLLLTNDDYRVEGNQTSNATWSLDRARNISETGGSDDGAAFSRRSAGTT